LKSQLPPPEAEATVPTLVGDPTYVNYIGPLFMVRCLACHGDLATAGLNLLTYESAMKGGEKGAVIVPGNSASSLLVQIQSTGKHFANLSQEELDIVKQWINAGAPQK
jgi:hypothetical protein